MRWSESVWKTSAINGSDRNRLASSVRASAIGKSRETGSIASRRQKKNRSAGSSREESSTARSDVNAKSNLTAPATPETNIRKITRVTGRASSSKSSAGKPENSTARSSNLAGISKIASSKSSADRPESSLAGISKAVSSTSSVDRPKNSSAGNSVKTSRTRNSRAALAQGL